MQHGDLPSVVLRRVVAIALAACTVSIALASRAANRSTEQQEAQALFERSAEEFRNGNFREAVDHLTRAYELTHQPVLLYNIARAHEELQERRLAIVAYERYLHAQSTAEDRAAVETKIASLRAADAEASSKQSEETKRPSSSSPSMVARPPAIAPPPVVAPSSSSSTVPWIVVASGGAMALGGAVFVFLGANQHAQALSEPIQARAADFNRTASTDATIANVLFIAGGAVAAGGLLWLGMTRPSSRKTAWLAAGAGPGWIGARGSFH